MKNIKCTFFIIFSSASLSFISKSNDLFQDLNNSINSKNPELYGQVVEKILSDGQTPLTFFIKEVISRKNINSKEVNNLQIKAKNLDKKFLYYLDKLLIYAKYFLNIKNKDGQLPLELALKSENFDFAVKLINSGADIALLNSSLLEKRIGEKSLISQLILSYISYYIVFLSSLKKGSFFEKSYKFSLQDLVEKYFAKCRLNNSEEKDILLGLVIAGKSKIFAALNKKSNNFRKRYLPKAYYHARAVFSEEKEDKLDDKECELDLNKLISTCFCKISRNIKYAGRNTDQVFFDNLSPKKNKNNFKNNFIDTQINFSELIL